MTTPPPGAESAPQPQGQPLGPAERRVLGVLIEKAKTTPAGYPMSVNAILAGCNQKNNRDPVTSYEEHDVEIALTELQRLGVVKELDWVGRVPKYKHFAYEWLGVRPVELAVLAELLLRGPQALGELRARAARMEPIEDITSLKSVVQGLVERGLMIELTPPGRGQVVSHALYTAVEMEELRARHGGRAVAGREAAGDVSEARVQAARSADAGAGPETQAALSQLRAELAELRERVDRLESAAREPDPSSEPGDPGDQR